MKALVTGATGLLGRAVVSELHRRGHSIRAMIRPASNAEALRSCCPDAEFFRSDLRSGNSLESAFDGVDVLVHLAAAVTGSEDLQFASTAVGTERLLEAMAKTQTKALVLASSFSVYDWSEINGTLSEDSPLEADVYGRDGYAIAKIWQERIARRMSRDNGWNLTVLRPGFIWGKGNEFVSGAGQSISSVHVVIAPLATPPLTHVVNCADAFVTAAEQSSAARERILNVVDGHPINSWQFFGRYLRETKTPGLRLPVPYHLGLALVRLADKVKALLFKGKGRLPSLLVPARFEARFKPLRFDQKRLQRELNWRPPLTLDECFEHTYGQSQPAIREPGRDAAPGSASRSPNPS